MAWPLEPDKHPPYCLCDECLSAEQAKGTLGYERPEELSFLEMLKAIEGCADWRWSENNQDLRTRLNSILKLIACLRVQAERDAYQPKFSELDKEFLSSMNMKV